jgi:hypothetical protein
MNKFVSLISADNTGIKESRAKNLGEEVKIEMETLVNNLKRDKLSMENKLARLTDLAPKNAMDLTVGGENFDAKTWVKDLQNTKIQILNKEIELKVAQETFSEWFADSISSPTATA